MAAGIPPPPLNSPAGSYYWLEWYTNLTNFLNGTNIPWHNLNFTGSNLTDLQTRNHDDLQNIHGGGGVHYHLAGFGWVNSAASLSHLPNTWTVSRTGVGTYVITHGQAIADPTGTLVTANLIGNTGYAKMLNQTNNTFQINTYNTAGASADSDFSFMMGII